MAVTKPSLWARAYKGLQTDDPGLVKKFNYCLGIADPSARYAHDSIDRLDAIQQGALEELGKAQRSEEAHKTTEKIKDCFKKAVTIVMKCDDYIKLAVSFNPYAAMAWTGVSLLLPVSRTHYIEEILQKYHFGRQYLYGCSRILSRLVSIIYLL